MPKTPKPFPDELSLDDMRPIRRSDIPPHSELVHNPRSTFYGYTPESVFEILKKCRAKVIAVRPHDPALDDGDTEGYLLFRQLRPQNNVYIPLTGAVVFYTWQTDRYGSSRTTDKKYGQLPDDLKVYSKIKLSYLRKNCLYMGLVDAGQMAGLLEFMIRLLARIASGEGKGNARYQAIRAANLFHHSSQWFLSGFAATNSTLLEIPVEELLNLLQQRVQHTPPVYSYNALVRMTNTSDTTKDHRQRFIRRAYEELSLRQSQHLIRVSLLELGRDDRVLTLYVHDYYLRKLARFPDLIARFRSIGRYEKNSKLKPTMYALPEEICWYVGGFKDTSVVGRILDDIRCEAEEEGHPVPLWKPGAPNTREYSFDFDALIQYYLDGVNKIKEYTHAKEGSKK